MLTLLTQLLRQPPIIVGIIAFVGLVAQKADFQKTVLGTLKTTLGFIILQIGINAIVGSMGPFASIFVKAFGITGVISNDEAAAGLVIPLVGFEVGAIMGLSMVVSIIAARLSPWKNIYLSGHKQWGISSVVAFSLHLIGLDSMMIILLGSIITGLYLTWYPQILQPFLRQVTGTDDFGIGHAYTLHLTLNAIIAKYIGNPKDKIDDLKLPAGLEIFRDMAFTTALIFLILYTVVATIAGEAVVSGFTGGLNMYLWALMQAFSMAAGLLTLIYGVKMLLAEIVPAFVGISKKLIPGARPALDVPVLFPYSPTGTLVGFVVMFITWAVVGMPLAAATTGVIPVPSMTGIFFGGGTAGVVANGMGGRRACILSGVINGIIWPFLVSWFYPFLPMASLAPGIAWLCYDNMSLALGIVGLGMLLGLY